MIILTKLRGTPRQYSKTLAKKELIKIVQVSRIHYYDEGVPWISDDVYDIVCERLSKIDPKNPLLYSGEITEVDKIEKVELPHFMPSVDKVKPEDNSAKKWLRGNPGPYCISDKEDGISLQIVSLLDEWRIYTKGSTGGGVYGKDISHLAKGLGLPPIGNVGYNVRAELIVTPENFEKIKKIMKRDYSNPRNFISSLTTKLKVDNRVLKLLDVMAYEIFNSDLEPSQQ